MVSFIEDKKYKNSMVASPQHLASVFKYNFDPIWMQTIDCIYRCFWWMAFAGVPSKYATSILKSEVNTKTKKIRHKGKVYAIPDAAIAAFNIGVEADTLNYTHPLYIKAIKRDRIQSSYLMSGFRQSQMEYKYIDRKCRDLIKEKGWYLTYERIYLSGVFYRAFEGEKQGIEPDFKWLAEEQLGDGGKTTLNEKELKFKIRMIKGKYNKWKRMFS